MAQGDVGIYASQISGHLWAPSGAYDALATVTVPSGGAASITFAGIPTGYKHLQLRMSTQGNRATYAADGFNVQFNGDTGNNYTWHELMGNGSSASSGATTSTSAIDIGQPGTNASNGAFAASVMDILDYANVSKNKVTRTLNGIDVNGTSGGGTAGIIALKSGLWLNTSAITSIKLYPAIATLWNEYSSFALYGVK